MIRPRILLAMAVLAVSPAAAQQKPLVSMGGQTRQLPAGTTLGVSPSTTGTASINIPTGVAPTSPANGDCWTVALEIACRVNGNTVGPVINRFSNFALNGGLNFPNDGVSKAAQIDSYTLTGTRTLAQIGRSIELTDGQVGPESGPSTITSLSASYGLSITGYRPNWATSGITGEMDGISVVLRQASSDAATLLSNIGIRDGFAATLESITSSMDTSEQPINSVRTQLGVANPRDDFYMGLGLAAEKGLGLNVGMRIYSYPGATWAKFIEVNDQTGANVFSIDGPTARTTFGGDTQQNTRHVVGPISAADLGSNWIETLRPASTAISQSISVSPGYIGQLAATRTSDNDCVGGCQGAIGYEAIVLNDNIEQIQFAYGAYIEAIRGVSNAGTTHGMEINVRNLSTMVPITPNTVFADGITPGLWLASGAGYTDQPNTAAMGVVANGTQWDKGIVFAIDGVRTRADSRKEAISMGLDHAISWRDSTGDIFANITAQGEGDGTIGMNQTFDANGTLTFSTTTLPIMSLGQAEIVAFAPLILAKYTVAALPPCGSLTAGAMVSATDLTAVTYSGTPAGGGSLNAPVYCNGTSWTIH